MILTLYFIVKISFAVKVSFMFIVVTVYENHIFVSVLSVVEVLAILYTFYLVCMYRGIETTHPDFGGRAKWVSYHGGTTRVKHFFSGTNCPVIMF